MDERPDLEDIRAQYACTSPLCDGRVHGPVGKLTVYIDTLEARLKAATERCCVRVRLSHSNAYRWCFQAGRPDKCPACRYDLTLLDGIPEPKQ